MKKLYTLLVAVLLLPYLASGQSVEKVNLYGYLGKRIDDCIEHRVMGQDVDYLVEPFRHRNEFKRWQSEFWGKWTLGAIETYRYTQDPALYKKIEQGVADLIATQSKDGYIGNYAEEHQPGRWDVWGRKYTSLALLAWYDLSHDRKALKVVEGVINHLIAQLKAKNIDIAEVGLYKGMPSCSILEPVVYLYNRTKNEKYLDFAKYIAEQMDKGAELITKGENGVAVANRTPLPEKWFSRDNGHKAYEMMSCYEGLIELYKITGEKRFLVSAEKSIESIVCEEINIAGSGSAFECWYGGASQQYIPTYHTMETCVTFTWMQLCHRMLALTGDVKYADYMERTIYNALLASLKADGTQIAKYSPLEGWRTEGERQCGMNINCCNANGPRAFAMIPHYAYKAESNGITINLYNKSQAMIALGKNHICIEQKTDYPATDKVEIVVSPDKEAMFDFKLRIPAWSEINSVAVNGVEVKDVTNGYLTISRKWSKGDVISLTFDLRARLYEQGNHQAIMRGPVVLTRDSRFGDGFVDESSVIQHKEGIVEVTPIEGDSFAWLTFAVPAVMGTDLEGHRTPRQIKFCDFASAGNTWEKTVRYKVWLPKTLDVKNSPYKPYND